MGTQAQIPDDISAELLQAVSLPLPYPERNKATGKHGIVYEVCSDLTEG